MLFDVQPVLAIAGHTLHGLTARTTSRTVELDKLFITVTDTGAHMLTPFQPSVEQLTTT